MNSCDRESERQNNINGLYDHLFDNLISVSTIFLLIFYDSHLQWNFRTLDMREIDNKSITHSVT